MADGQALMDYVIGGTPISCADKADLDGDGAVNTYDVHLFLSRYSTGLVTVEAGQKVKIGVEVALTQAQKEALEESNSNGAYGGLCADSPVWAPQRSGRYAAFHPCPWLLWQLVRSLHV